MEFSQIFLIVGVSIIGFLGTIHLIYTLFTNKFETRDANLTQAMKNVSPNISGDTSVWNAWIGFNLSHSTGVIFFALIYIPLAVNYMEIIEQSIWLSFLPVIVGVVYMILAKRYWFKVPLYGISLSTFFMLTSFICLKLGY